MSEQKKMDFSIKEIREKIRQEIAEGFSYHPDEMRKWHRIRKGIEEFLREKGTLKETDPLIYEECVDLLDKAKWFSFVYLPFNDFIDLFRQGLKYALVNKTYPLEKNTSIFLMDVTLLSVRDETKTKMREAMFANEEELTSDKINVKNRQLEPTIGNWLKFYDMELGTGNVEKLKTLGILFNNENVIKLPAGERETIKRLIDFYEELKISAMTVEGLEEEDYVVDEDGKIELHRRNSVEPISREFAKMEQDRILKQEMETQMEAKVEKIKQEEMPVIDINQATEEAIKKINLNFPDENLEKKLRNIILSFLRDVRTGIETKITLKREPQIGGMGLDQGTTDRIMDILKEIKPRIDQGSFKKIPQDNLGQSKLPEKISFPADKVDKLVQIETKVQPLSVEPIDKEEKIIIPKPEPVFEMKQKFPIPPIINQTPISKPQVVFPKQEIKERIILPVQTPVRVIKQEIKPEIEVKPKAEIKVPSKNIVPPEENIFQVKTKEPVNTEIPIHRPFPGADRPAVEEMRVRPKIYGPVDELRTITLVDWRRWGSPKEAAKTIQDKINLLGDESLVKKAEGIRAWKDSEVNQLYLDIGAESIDQVKSVNEMIAQRQQQNKLTLTEEEFNAVVELNQKLRF